MENTRELTTIYYLEMLQQQELCVRNPPPGFAVSLVDPPSGQLNRYFYETVGPPWEWFDRLDWSDDDWSRYAGRSAMQTWVGRLDDENVGYFELESQPDGNVQILYFGLLPEFIGRGLGGALLTAATERAWSIPATRRVWLHSCTKDHPNALTNYCKRGFKVYKEEVKAIQQMMDGAHATHPNWTPAKPKKK